MLKSSSKDLSEEEDVEDSKEKEDSGSDEDYEDPGFWSVIHGKEAYFCQEKMEQQSYQQVIIQSISRVLHCLI